MDTSDFKLNSLVFFLIFVVFMSDFNTCFVRTSTVIAECGILVFTYSIYNNFLYKKIDMFIVEYLTQRKDFKLDITENTDHINTFKSITAKIVAIIINITRKKLKNAK